MPRIPMLPGLRLLVPRASFISRPILPIASRIAIQRPTLPAYSSWRMFSYSPLRSRSPSSPPRSPSPSSRTDGREGHSRSGSRSSLGPDATLSERLKHLIKTYGWYALGVYITISTLDFSVAFAAINVIGAEQVQHVVDVAKQRVASVLHSAPPEPGKQEYETSPTSQTGREGLYAMIVLAYTVHKTLFLPIRVGLTAGLTPKLVGWLTRRGWAGGEGTKRAAREMRNRMRRDRD
ncbi:NAT2 [Sanghuangporus weigelae]